MPSFARVTAATLLLSLLSGTAMAQSRCGDAETVRPGETLAEFATRCAVPVDRLLEVNPDIAQDEVEEGLVLLLPQEEEVGWADRARNAVREAGRQVEEAATQAGRSVTEYLSEQPDLNRDILEFGERLGVPGVSAPPDRGAELVADSSAGAPGDIVELLATGLPGDAEVVIGAWIQGEFIMLERTETDTNGRLVAAVEVPEVPETEDRIRFMIRTVDERLTLTSDPFGIQSRT